jgi:acyl carrier protein
MKFGEIERKVKHILADKLDIPIEKIKRLSLLNDELGLDSFGKVEITFALEETFNVSLLKPTGRRPNITTLKDLVGFLKLKIDGKDFLDQK